MKNKIQWVDFKALERDDVDEFGLFDFLLFGTRTAEERWWFAFVPGLNLLLFIWLVFTLSTFPIRWYINASQLKKLRRNAYDIEDTYFLYRLIRGVNGDIGLCEWGESYELSRKVLLESRYARICRLNKNDGFIVTDKNNRMGLYMAQDNEWIFPCICDNISIESDDIINVTINNRSQRYNFKGDRIIR